MIRKRLLYIMLLIGCAHMQATNLKNVAGTWTSVSLTHGFEHGLGLTLRGEYRSTDNLSQTELFFLRATGSYKPCPYFQTAVAYDFLGSKKKGLQTDGITPLPYIQPNHRILVDAQPMYAKDGFTVLLRERYVFAYLPAVENISAQSAFTHTLRTYPQVSYHIADSRWTPFVAVELYNNIAAGKRFELSQYHVFAGTNVKLDDRFSLRLFYVMQHKVAAEKIVHTIGVDYLVKI